MCNPPHFEIGLVMAGAISAGAYTAGVIDFLFEALDEWEKARLAGIPICPPHHIKIKVLSGSSAGGMTAALVAGSLGLPLNPVKTLNPCGPVADNLLYKSWVQDIDISRMLETRDLADVHQPVRSLLDCTVLDEIAQNAFTGTPGNYKRPYLDENLEIFLTVTNLRGVPYIIKLSGGPKAAHAMSLHGDYFHFYSGPQENSSTGAVRLDPQDRCHASWQLFRQVALATGAFPAGLAPRWLKRPPDDYKSRQWPFPAYPDDKDDKRQFWEMKEILPAWENTWPHPKLYHFLAVDGGVVNNEPLELARRCLAGHEQRNCRNPECATRAVIMIDPFPRSESPIAQAADKDDLLSTLKGTLTGLRSQAMFKLDELLLAMDETVYSRFLIAPVRHDSRAPVRNALACRSLGGFGGFLAQAFREHDYHLGRRNCQQFLRCWLAFPAEKAKNNPVFKSWPDDLWDHHKFCKQDDSEQECYVPLIPLLGSAAREVPPVPWPSFSQDQLNELKKGIHRRACPLLPRLIDSLKTAIPQAWARSLLKGAARICEQRLITNKITASIAASLKEDGLLR